MNGTCWGMVMLGWLLGAEVQVDVNGVQVPVLSRRPEERFRQPLDLPAAEGAAAPSDAPAAAPPSTHVPESESPTEKVARLRPTQLLRDLLAPTDERLEGEQLNVETVLRESAGQRSRQIDAVIVYWRLARAQGQFACATRAVTDFETATKPQATRADVQSALARYRARALAVKRVAIRAQYDLADLLRHKVSEPLPLAVDLPHVGPYETEFARQYSSGNAPPRLVLLTRRIELLKRLLDARCAAVEAASDLKSADHVSTLVLALDRLYVQQKEFLRAAEDYNADIAEYALTVAPDNATAERLAAMLVTKPRSGSPSDGALRQPRWPNPLLRRILLAELKPRNYQVMRANLADESTLYRGLLDLEPGPRTQKLGQLLSRTDSQQSGRLTLRTALADATEERRLPVIRAYWTAEGAASRLRAAQTLLEQLQELHPLALQLSSDPSGAEAGVQLQAAIRAAEADVAQQQVDVLSGQFALAKLVQSPIREQWPVPVSLPHTGRIELAGEPKNLTVAKYSRLLETSSGELRQLSEAVVLADAARGRELDLSRQHPEVPRLLAAIEAVTQQSQRTQRFLKAAQQYNIDLATYATNQLSPGSATERLLQALLLPAEIEG